MNDASYHVEENDAGSASLPVKVPARWRRRLVRLPPDHPLALQVLPGPAESMPVPGDLADPVGERGCSPVPLVVRKHADRAVLLVSRRCFLHCRYCFRRGSYTHEEPGSEEIEAALGYLRGAGLAEVILSGGDPLSLPDVRLLAIMDALRPQVPVLRVHTRAPVVAPERVTPALVRSLRQRAPVWVVVHVNCVQELDPEVDQALARLVDAGLPVLNQSVLLRGVNDSVEALEQLSRALVQRRVHPYYLHHPDAARGNGHLRVPLSEGIVLYEALQRRLGGLSLPRYVVDRPDGAGKVDAARYASELECLEASSSESSQA